MEQVVGGSPVGRWRFISARPLRPDQAALGIYHRRDTNASLASLPSLADLPRILPQGTLVIRHRSLELLQKNQILTQGVVVLDEFGER